MVCEIIEIKNGAMKINYLGCIFGPSVEDFDVSMANTIDKLMTEKGITNIVFVETREHEYDNKQTKMLQEIADAVNEIINEKKLVSAKLIGENALKLYPDWYSWIYSTISFQMRGDPVGAYLNIGREIRRLKILQREVEEDRKECIDNFLNNILLPIKEILKKCRLIRKSLPFIEGYRIGDRSIYRKFFHPLTRPNFMYTKFVTKSPSGGELITKYSIGNGIDVEIFKVPGKVRPFYHIIPPEFKLSEQEYMLLDDARRTLEARHPKELETRDQAQMRELFYSIGLELLRDLAEIRNVEIDSQNLQKLAGILTRYTAGMGIIELLLADSKIEDISINAPFGALPIYVKHSDFDECQTNLIPTMTDGDRWSTRFKLLSGRPLDEANPVLDTEIVLPEGVARVAAIAPRLSPDGLAFALRRHRFDPWTFPLYINVGFMDSLFAGLMWFFVTYGRTILVAGTRGAGKSSLLGSMMLQVLPYYRVITSEDTLELPVEALRRLGYNVQRLKSRSVITKAELELSAEDVIRTSLRLGDSCLFIGEVRSKEAIALYEAMRIGALANVVAGTIHGDSAYGVFDRVVNDLGVPPTSFKATDLVVVCNKLRRPGELRQFRRVVELTEVRKHWKEDPLAEHGFINLMEYSAKEDKLKPTDIFLNGESYVINEIARRVPGWAGRWDLIWENINLRGKVMQAITDIAKETGRKDLMEANVVVKSNQMFEALCKKSRDESGEIVPERVFSEWEDMFKKYAKGTLKEW